MRWPGSSGKFELVAVGLLIAGCALSGPRSPPDGATACGEPRPQVCTMDYDPVCGIRYAAGERTYGNACGACADPAVVAYVPGACSE